MKFVQERGKYTVVGNEKNRKKNCPENRTDYKKKVSNVTIKDLL
ncbi:hypothetical protein [Bacillus toyonensis]